MRATLLTPDRTVLDALVPGAHQVAIDDRPDVVLLAGDPQAVPLELLVDVTAAVERGAVLVCLGPPEGEGWQAITGVRPGELVPGGEVFATVAARSRETARITGEFPVAGTFRWLEPVADVATLLTSSIRYAHRPALVQRRLGQGRVVTCGFGPDAIVRRGSGNEELVRVLRRLVEPTADATERVLGVGVVGYGPYGGMGSLHGTAAAQTDGLALAAVVDTADDRRKAAEDEFPGVTAYEALDAMLADDAVDVVVVATPPNTHADLALACLRAGKHVAVEKPLCITTTEADQLLRAATEGDRMLTVHQNRRWDADFRALRRAVDAGLLGEVFNVETFVGGFEHPCRAWHSELSVSGGAIYDWGSHHLDWILLLLDGAPASVTTTRHKRVWHDITNDDQVRVRLAWADGREAEFLQSDIAGVRRPKVYVQGTEGTVAGHYRPVVTETVEHVHGYQRHESHHAEAPVELTLARYERGYGLTHTTLPPLPAEAWPFHRNIADHLLLGEPLEVDPTDVRRVIGVLEAAQRSGDEGGRTIELEPAG
jgi:predicted dehydrogenase